MTDSTTDVDDTESLFELTQAVHGHRCPASAMGLRAGLAARDALGVDADANGALRCYVSTGPSHPVHCFVDGVQIGTGCTYGKGNIEKLNHAKNALTLVDTASDRQVRVSLDPGWFGNALENSPFVAARRAGVAPMDVDDEVTDSAVESVLTTPEEELLVVGEVTNGRLDDDPDRSFYWEHCDECGEVTFEPGLRVVEGGTVCVECARGGG
jgi:formylmethanofuran dehydrogenase subunit E